MFKLNNYLEGSIKSKGKKQPTQPAGKGQKTNKAEETKHMGLPGFEKYTSKCQFQKHKNLKEH